MKIKKIEWKNFTSYGNKKQILDFNDSSLSQIVGENGAGKTSISQAISFVLYGKIDGKKLKDIPNRINGNTWVRIEFSSGSRDVEIIRGLEPSILEVKIDGKVYDRANVKIVQEFLNEEIIGIPPYVFNNTISLSINDFRSFIKMSSSDKREIIDKIFGFNVLNEMRTLLKSEIKKIREEIVESENRIESINESIKESQEQMDLLADKIKEDTTKKQEELEERLETFSKLMSIQRKNEEDMLNEEDGLESKILKIKNTMSQSEMGLSDIKKRISLYESDTCPTCMSPLSGSFHDDLKTSLLEDREKFSSQIEELKNLLDRASNKSADLKNKKLELRDKGEKIKKNLYLIQEELKKLDKSSKSQELDTIGKIIDSMNKSATSLDEKRKKGLLKEDWVKILDSVLGENGVKQMAIKTILPSINSEISDLLNEMSLPYRIVFDENFNATIFHMGVEVPVQTLSTGEMKKVDFVVLISMLKMMKLRFSSINLLFLDELFSSVDPGGVYSIVKILKRISKDLGLNIFVINHAPMPHEVFDQRIEVLKKNNFSTVNVGVF